MGDGRDVDREYVGLCGGWVVARLRGWERGECVVWFFFFVFGFWVG